MRISQTPNHAAIVRGGVFPRLAAAFVVCIVAIMLALFALPATSYAYDKHETGTFSDGTGGLKVLSPVVDDGDIQATAVSDDLVYDMDITATDYIASAKAFNEKLGLEPDDPGYLPEDMTNIFCIENSVGFSGKTTYCMLIMTEDGTYFLGSTEGIGSDGAGFKTLGYDLNANSYKEDLVFYSPITLSEQLQNNQFIEDDIYDILRSMTKVTAQNVSTIPFPDPETFSAENPETFLLIPMLYDAPALPENFNPAQLPTSGSGNSGSNASAFYYVRIYSVFTVASPEEIIFSDMVLGTFEENDDLTSPGEAGTYLWVPEFDDFIGIGWYEGEDSTSEEEPIRVWKVPEGSRLDFVSWINNDTTIATGASLTNLTDPSIGFPITDIDFSADRDTVVFSYTVPEYNY